MKTSKIYYGWIVAFCCMMLAFSINAMGNNAVAFYVAPVSGSFNVSRVTTNFFLFTTGLLTRTICGFFYGKLARMFGIKRLMLVGFCFVVSGYLTYASAGSIAMIGLGSGLYGIAHALGTLNAYNVIINNWFIKNKGLALGMINTAIGAGGMLINPLIGNWIINVGWSRSFLNTIVLISAIAIPCLVFVKEAPHKMGLSPWGAAAPDVRDAAQGAAGDVGTPDVRDAAQGAAAQGARGAGAQGAAPPGTAGARAYAAPVVETAAMGHIFKLNRFWMLIAVLFLTGLSSSSAFTNMIPSLAAAGISPYMINNVLGMLMPLGSVVGHLSSGYIYDRYGLVQLMTVAVGIVVGGMLIMSAVTSSTPAPVLIFTVLCIGYSNAISLGTLTHTINYVLFDHRAIFPSLFGFLFAVQNIGAMIGSPIFGLFYDKTGSYRPAYLLAAVLLMSMYFVFRVSARMALARQAESETF